MTRTAIIMWVALLFSCVKEKQQTLFTLLKSDVTGIDFVNSVQEDDTFNILTYEYLYNGGGVAAGDLNNDGNIDLFFTGNQVSNKLYLNRGDWKFEDVTHAAGLSRKKGWTTGVTLADVNADGYLDIYVCYSGPGSDQDRCNELFINHGGPIPKFTERAAEYGLSACGTFSTQASFFDYDRDGDLDMFLLNHARITYNPFFNSKKLRATRHPQYGNRLYRNDNGNYQDVSALAGIHGSGVNFGLGVSVADLNADGWLDLYVTNDYEEQDFFYINQKDGTFLERLKDSFRHIARNGMGCDVADYNNDGLPDVIVVDMLPEDNYRQKILKGPDEYDKYNLLRDSGYHHQNMRNVLQLNTGIRDGVPVFSEIGQLAGVSNTDWSWCPLFADLDNDGWKDLLITNGFLRDFTNMDFVKYVYQDEQKRNKTYDIVKQLPSSRIQNYVFRNKGDLTFENFTKAWGITDQSISNGAAYADLDNDGDLDIVTNNINQPCFLYRNNTDRTKNHFMKVKLLENGDNRFSIGAKVGIVTGKQVQVQDLIPTRGFQSCMPAELLFGLGSNDHVDSLWVRWPDGKVTSFTSMKGDTTLIIHGTKGFPAPVINASPAGGWLTDVTHNLDVDYRHTENDFVDYKVQYLLPYQVSRYGPCLTAGDVDQDGNDDFFIGGAIGHPGKLFLRKGNAYSDSELQPWTADTLTEDTGALFFDADGDGDQDLYLVKGGTDFLPEAAPLLQDRFYNNDGKGNFREVTQALPREISNGSSICVADFDKDGDLDAFVGARSIPGNFPMPSVSLLLRNDSKDGSIKFSNVTPPFLRKPGIVTTCAWSDVNHDSWPDLIVAGEFMPVMVFQNEGGELTDRTNALETSTTSGLWCKILPADVDGDGDQDLIAGNAGANLPFKASVDHPIVVDYGDFNGDGRIDPLISTSVQSKPYPYASRDELLEQLPALKRKFVSYSSYANATLNDVLTPEQLKASTSVKAFTSHSAIFWNDGKGRFTQEELPPVAQFSMNSAIVFEDFNKDGRNEIMLAGNFYPYRVQAGRSDASSGLILEPDRQHGTFLSGLFPETGFYAEGDVRSLVVLRTRSKERIVVLGVNDGPPKFFRFETK